MTNKILSLLFCFAIGIAFAQKKSITHDDYDLWKSINNTKISENGKLIVTTVRTATGRGDGYLEIYNTENQQKANYFNGIVVEIYIL